MRAPADFLRFIRFSHTVFALPFALGAMFVAARGWPSAGVAAGVVAAMVFARTAAMAFNRITDWEIDKRNPRTAGRHRLASRGLAIAVCLVCSAGFIVAAWQLNPLCFLLSPVALGLIFFYSFTKRFTHFAQFFLGLALSVLLWAAGFDLIYATQDYDVDLRDGLHSMVVRLGVPGALRLAVWLHAAAFVGLAGFGLAAGMGRVYFSFIAIVLAALIYEHLEARRGSVASINRAFFQANAVVGIAFVAGTLLDCLARS